jgi:tetratricopeptide (TPR) repeat protein
MKKRTLLILILLVFVVLAGAAGGGYYWLKSKTKPLELPLYANMEEIQRDIEGLEGLREAKGLSWQDAFRLGVAYIHAGRLDDAVTTLEEARGLRPRFHKIHESLGMAYFRLGELDKAITVWEKALEMRPDATHLEEMIKRAGQRLAFEKRISTLEQVMDKGRAGWVERLELASLYISMRRLDEAKVQIEEALREKQDSPELYDALAQAHAMGGDFEKAVEALKKAVQLNPDDEVLGKRLEEMEELQAAVKSGDLWKPAP